MDNSFLQYFKQFTFLNLQDLKLLYGIFRIKKVKKGELLVRAGEINYQAFLIKKGLLRNYIITSDGEERTILLSKEGMQTGSPQSFFFNKPAIENIDALEDSLVWQIDMNKFKALSKRHTRFLKLEVYGLRENMKVAVERLHFYTSMSPEERFLFIRDTYPDFLQRVPQKYLASYIGVTTVSLSRIKTRTMEKDL